MLRLTLLTGLATLLTGTVGLAPPRREVVLWAWERAERLDFIDTETTSVAFLAQTLRLEGDEVLPRPRRQPLVIASGTRLTAVVRVESSLLRPPSLSSTQRLAAAQRIVASRNRAATCSLQIDFDARRLERAFYRDLLADVRERLPAGTRLTITALASWCLDDPWIEGLSVDEAVPMLFSMGHEGASIRRRLGAGAGFPVLQCQTSVGVSTTEPWPAMEDVRRLWVFSREPWTPEGVARVFARRAGRRP